MATYERWEIYSNGAWSQPSIGVPDPFNDLEGAPPHPIASWTSVSVYAPGLGGDIFVIGSLFKNSRYAHIWRYIVDTNTWSYVTTWDNGSEELIYGISASYGFGPAYGAMSVSDRPYILFTIINEFGEAGHRFAPGGFLYFFYDDDEAPTITQPEILQNILYPHMLWDGQNQWMFGTDTVDNTIPHMYYRLCSGTNTWSEIYMSGPPETNPEAVRDALFAYIEDPNPRILLSHGALTSDSDTIVRKTWIFDGSIWTDVTPLGDDYDEPSARKEMGVASNGSQIWMLGGYGWQDYVPAPEKAFLSSIFIWMNSETRWSRESDFEFGAENNMRCCGKMDSGLVIPIILE